MSNRRHARRSTADPELALQQLQDLLDKEEEAEIEAQLAGSPPQQHHPRKQKRRAKKRRKEKQEREYDGGDEQDVVEEELAAYQLPEPALLAAGSPSFADVHAAGQVTLGVDEHYGGTPREPAADEGGPLRARLLAHCVARAAPRPPPLCSKCHATAPAVRCRSCLLGGVYLCCDCDRSSHCHAHMHERSTFAAGYFKPLQPSQQVNSDGELRSVDLHFNVPPTHQCTSGAVFDLEAQPLDRRPIKLVTRSGRFDFTRAKFKCGSCAAEVWQDDDMLMRLGFFPCSADPRAEYYIAEDVCWDWRLRQHHSPGCSFSAYMKELDDKSLQSNNSNTIDPKRLRTGYQQWRAAQAEVERLQHQHPNQCPCCIDGQHMCAVDGNMKLSNYARPDHNQSATSYYTTRPDSIFIPDGDAVAVCHLTDQVCQGGSISAGHKQCGGSWQKAGDAARKYANLAVTGCALSACGHLVIQHGINMVGTGERFAYMLSLVARQASERNIQFVVGDLMCKWYPWMQKVLTRLTEPGMGELRASLAQHGMALTAEGLGEMRPVVAGLHAKLHSWFCQVVYGPAWREGMGTEDGEVMERIFAYLSRLCNSTKYMGEARRMDVLAEQCMDENRDKINGLPQFLARRYETALEKLRVAECEYNTAVADLQTQHPGVVVADTVMEQWCTEIRAAAQRLQDRNMSRVDEQLELARLMVQLQRLRVLEELTSPSNQGPVGVIVAAAPGSVDATGAITDLLQQLPQVEKHLSTLQKAVRRQGQHLQPGTGPVAAAVAEVRQTLTGVDAMLSTLPSSASAATADALADCITMGAKLGGKLQALAVTVQHAGSFSAAMQRELAEAALQDLELELESLAWQMGKWHRAVQQDATSAKERTQYRRRMDQLDKTIQQRVRRYNAISGMGSQRRGSLTADQVKSGDHPWHFLGLDAQGTGTVPFKAKLHVGERHQRRLRCREQLVILLQDMDKYVAYYARTLKLLQEQAQSCTSVAGAMHNTTVQDQGSLIQGQQALARAGAVYVEQQLAAAARHFHTASEGQFRAGTHWQAGAR